MAISTSETSPLPLQLQIESQVEGRQRLAYLPTTGPSMDFYYLNYRPSYRAGESKVDFWMLTPKGTPAPKTGSLELYDEFGKIRLAVLVPEGTEIPQGEANKNEPFLWKSWAVPKTLKADFDFSEKFRVVLKTSDSKPASASTIITTAKKNKNKNKRWDYDATLKDFLLARKKNSAVVTAATVPAAAPVPANSVASSPIVVQDRQFHIKGLQATPGGKPNPAKLNVNKVITPPSQVAPNQIIPSQVDVDSKASNINSKSRISDNTAINTGADAHANANKPVSGKTNNNINNKSVVSSAMTRTVLPPFATILVVLLSALTALY
ncbi:hypothetical protein BGZ58_007493 [Dissophora ornata]|nr:hypothetical protein BGZ58_007493 [Dissophora ornata]